VRAYIIKPSFISTMIENALTEYHDRREIERSLAIFHIHNYEDVDIDDVITELAFLKGRRPALFL